MRERLVAGHEPTAQITGTVERAQASGLALGGRCSHRWLPQWRAEGAGSMSTPHEGMDTRSLESACHALHNPSGRTYEEDRRTEDHR